MSKRKRRLSTVAEVWDFLHPFVVNAAQRGVNLEGWDPRPADADSSPPRLYLALLGISGEPSAECMQWLRRWHPYWHRQRMVQYLLGVSRIAHLDRLFQGWDKEDDEPRDEWGRLGWQLHDAYVEAQAFPCIPFQPTQWAPLPPRDSHKRWVHDDRESLSYLKVPNTDGRKLYVIHPKREGTPYKWINGITGNSGEAPTVHVAQVAVEQDLVEHLRKMLAFMGAS